MERLTGELIADRDTTLNRLFHDTDTPTPYFCWNPSLTDLPDPILRALGHWLTSMPRDGDHLLAEAETLAPELAGNLIVLRRLANGDLRFERYGAALVPDTGYDWTGRRLSDMASRNMAAVFYRAGYDAAARRGHMLYTENISMSAFRMKTWCRLVLPVRDADGGPWGFAVANVAFHGLPDWSPVRPRAHGSIDPVSVRFAARHRRRLSEGYPRLLTQIQDTYTELLGAQLANIAMLTTDGQAFRYVNPPFLALLGVDDRVIPRLNPSHLFPAQADFASRVATLKAGGTVADFETEFLTPDGQSLFAQVRLRSVRHVQSPAIGLSVVDLTARREREQILHEARRMEAIGQLTGGVAHDFNNILGVIMLNLDLLQQKVGVHGDAGMLIDDALSSAEQGRELIQHLLAFARKQTLQPRIVDPGALIEDMARLLGRTLGEHIEIRLHIAPGVWPLAIDPALLRNALTNLATNARDAMPNGGQLHIAVRNRSGDDTNNQPDDAAPMGDRVVIEVRDTGSGMTQETLARAFDPFFTTKPQGKGTGLGLSMVLGFVRQSGGEVTVASELGVGSLFCLLLPRAPADRITEVRHDAAPHTMPDGACILVVEDNAALLQATARHLATLGYRVLTATSGVAALEITQREFHLDLVLSDIVMPGNVSGLTLARWLERERPDTRILLTSGFSEEWYGEGAAELSHYRLLAKPYRNAELERAVRSVLESPAQATVALTVSPVT